MIPQAIPFLKSCLHRAAIVSAVALLWPAITTAANRPPDAHAASRKFIIDPTYDATKLSPSPAEATGKSPWIYGEGEFEAGVIERLVTEGFACSIHVDYNRNYRRSASAGAFRHAWPKGLQHPVSLTFRTNGKWKISIDDQLIASGLPAEQPQTIVLPPATTERKHLQFDLESTAAEPCALLIEPSPFQTDNSWEWSEDSRQWHPACAFAQTKSGRLPHQCEEPTLVLRPISESNGVFDFGRTILARPIFRCAGTPVIVAGESLAETQAKPAEAESRMDVEQLPDGRWTSRHRLGFRYLRITGGRAKELVAEASFHPVRYAGAFACSDEELTRIWMNSAFTLRNCMQCLMIDGVKRDRMPWAGDQSANLIVNAYTFAESGIIRHSLTALGRPTNGYINGIVDYSLWWVINQSFYQKYFDDPAYLKQELPRINAILQTMSRQTDANGFLRPDTNAWVFIDWGVQVDKTKTLTALQIMWYWAQHTGALLAQKAGDEPMAAMWSARADALGKMLQARAWNSSAQAWQEYLESPGANSPYPNMLAVLSGLADSRQHEGIRQMLTTHPCSGTPFMNGFYLMVLHQVGAPELATQRLKEYWGGMLTRGATTFWEDFKIGETNTCTMYDRPFGRSLCHAWASSPAAILPAGTLGIRPQRDGWQEFTVAPQLGGLKWAAAAVPTPKGTIEVAADLTRTIVKIPAGLTLLDSGKTYRGPQTVTLQKK